jgi:MMPL family
VAAPRRSTWTWRASVHDRKLIIPPILAVVLLILTLALRAVVAPLILTATVVLSFAAGLGFSAGTCVGSPCPCCGCAWLWSDQDVLGGTAGGCRGAVAVAELEHHLGDAGQREAGLDLGADGRRLQRLGMQAGEDPLAGGVEQ